MCKGLTVNSTFVLNGFDSSKMSEPSLSIIYGMQLLWEVSGSAIERFKHDTAALWRARLHMTFLRPLRHLYQPVVNIAFVAAPTHKKVHLNTRNAHVIFLFLNAGFKRSPSIYLFIENFPKMMSNPKQLICFSGLKIIFLWGEDSLNGELQPLHLAVKVVR